jgi:hypothetical protein
LSYLNEEAARNDVVDYELTASFHLTRERPKRRRLLRFESNRNRRKLHVGIIAFNANPAPERRRFREPQIELYRPASYHDVLSRVQAIIPFEPLGGQNVSAGSHPFELETPELILHDGISTSHGSKVTFCRKQVYSRTYRGTPVAEYPSSHSNCIVAPELDL